MTNSRADGAALISRLLDASAGAFSELAELSDPSELADPLAGVLAMVQSAARLSFKSCDEQDACGTVLALEKIRRFLDAAV